MKFASLGHLDYESRLKQLPKDWIHEKFIVSPEINCDGTKGYLIALKFSAQKLMNLPRENIQQNILDLVLFAQDELDVEIIQLGALTTSVTSGGAWLVEQKEYKGFVNHGDSYTAAVTCKVVEKALDLFGKKSSNQVLAIVGAYGIIGEAVSRVIVPKFAHSILIGRREEKLQELKEKIQGNFDTTTELKTKDADIIVTATSHPKALLESNHLKENAIVVDVSQPPNLSQDVCRKRSDIHRFDGGYVAFPFNFQLPGMPPGKLFACIAEVIMQAKENERKNHVGSIDLKHLMKTEEWAKKYQFELKELTNFGKTISQI